MKKTNVTQMHVASRLLKIVPVLLCIFLLSSANLAAQDFLPVEDAHQNVRLVVMDMPLGADVSTTASDETAMKNSLKRALYTSFIGVIMESNSTAKAYEEFEEALNLDKMPEQRRDAVDAVLEDLMDLITD